MSLIKSSSALHCLLLNSLIIQEIHNIEIINKLADHKIQHSSHYLWSAQLKFVIDRQNIIGQAFGSSYPYGFEY